MVIADEIDSLDSNLRTAVNSIIDTDRVLDDTVLLDLRLHLDIKESLSLIISLDNIYGSLGNIVGILAASFLVQTFLKIFLFTGFYASKSPA